MKQIILILSFAMYVAPTLFPPLVNHLLQMKLKTLFGTGLFGGKGGNKGGHGNEDVNGHKPVTPEPNTAFSNVCVFSNNPIRYRPRCFLCPDEAYPNILEACSETANTDIDFEQALCVEANCAVELPPGGSNFPIRVGRDTSLLLAPRGNESSLYSGPITLSDIQSFQHPEKGRVDVPSPDANKLHEGNIGGIVVINGTEFLIRRQVILNAVGKQ